MSNNNPAPMLHVQAEAFKLMIYRCDKAHVEMIWNSRDAVTPFGVSCRFCSDGDVAQHIFGYDQYAPGHKPQVGTRIFIDLTITRARKLRRAYVDEFWESDVGGDRTMKNSGMYKDQEDAVMKLSAYDMDSFAPHTPTIVVVGIDVPAS